MSSRKRTDDIELVHYKMDVIERRLDNIERILFSNKNNNGGDGCNNELMQLVMTLIRQQVVAPQTTPPVQTMIPTETLQTHPTSSLGVTQVDDPKAGSLDAFAMSRRRMVT
jgi:hypothetical protein